jgi:hypothetical protein
MPPLLKPSECTLLVLGSADQPNADDHHATAKLSRGQLLQAASVCDVPTLFAVRNLETDTPAPSSQPGRLQVAPLPMTTIQWGNTPLGLALAGMNRSSMLICGFWLDEWVTFTALSALGEGYDIYLVTDASPPLEAGERDTAIMRLVQAGVVPTSTKQVIREWAVEVLDLTQRSRLLALA